MTHQSSRRAKLRQFLQDRFGLSELKNLAFDLNVNFQSFPHETTSEFARELVNHLERREQLGYLVYEVLERRPDDELRQLFFESLASVSRVKTQSGEGRFDNAVESSLINKGYAVTAGKLLGHRRVDLYAESEEFGKTKKYVVECVDHSHLVDLDYVRSISGDYSNWRDQNLVDYVLIVSNSGLTREAQRYIDESRHFFHMTLQELRNSLMDFDSYLDDIISMYEDRGFHKYYIPARCKSSSVPYGDTADLMNVVASWLDNDHHPIALLGSYGIGKSTFMFHLAYTYATKCRSGEFGRVPILIRLREICSEQNLDGLLGRHFTSLHNVRGYNYQLFQELNKSGRFMLLLDGFDEMKHSMTTRVFRYTFKEILKLVQGSSKVILSGRPSAFLNEEERLEFLHACRVHRGREVPILGRPEFTEIEMAPFTHEQIGQFVDRYRGYRRSTEADSNATQDLPTREDFFHSPKLVEIAARPVQLRMLFEILPYYKGNLDNLTVLELYTYFIDLLLEREVEKPARQSFGVKERRHFHSSLAFYLWVENLPRVSIERIPDFCIPRREESTARLNSEDVKRDLLSGSFIEIRYPDEIHFPHRSIQEFLVADFLLNAIKGREGEESVLSAMNISFTFDVVDRIATPEIIDFMIAASGENDVRAGFQILRRSEQALGRNTFRYWTQNRALPILKDLAEEQDFLALIILVIGKKHKTWFNTDQEEGYLYNLVLTYFEPDEDMASASYFAKLMFAALLLLSDEADPEIRESWLERYLIALASYSEIRHVGRHGHMISGQIRPPNIARLLSRIQKIEKTEGELEFDLRSFLKHLRSVCKHKVGLDEWYNESSPRSGFIDKQMRPFTKISYSEELDECLGNDFDAEKLGYGK